MSFGSRLKEKRENLGITQPQLAKILGVSKGAIGNWETDVNSPRATLLYDLFDILNCDAKYLFQDETKEIYKDKATPEEFENIIKKYRALDPAGQSHVDTILDWEAARSADRLQMDARIAGLKAELETRKENPPLLLNAAHERTDIPVTEEMKQADDNIMDDENF